MYVNFKETYCILYSCACLCFFFLFFFFFLKKNVFHSMVKELLIQWTSYHHITSSFNDFISNAKIELLDLEPTFATDMSKDTIEGNLTTSHALTLFRQSRTQSSPPPVQARPQPTHYSPSYLITNSTYIVSHQNPFTMQNFHPNY